MGIKILIFVKLEIELVYFLEKIIVDSGLNDNEVKKKIDEVYWDLNGLKKGLDLIYDKVFSFYVYLIKYFLDNVYCSYFVYFFIY